MRSIADRSARAQVVVAARDDSDPKEWFISWQEGMPGVPAQALAEHREAQSGATSKQNEATRATKAWDNGPAVRRKRSMDLTLRRVGAGVNGDAGAECKNLGNGGQRRGINEAVDISSKC